MKKRYFVGGILLVCFFLSCQKGLNYSVDNPADSTAAGSQYYLKFKGNGVPYQYTQQTAAYFTTLNNLYNSSLIGETSALNGAEGMTISIYSDTLFVPNFTYTDGGLPVLGIPQTTLVFTDSSGIQYNSVNSSNPAVSLIFTTITPTYVQGTFSGNIKNQAGTDSLQVTEGSFVLPRS